MLIFAEAVPLPCPSSDRRLASKRLYTAAGVDIWHVGYSYDDDDNITAITDLVAPSNSLAFGYDSVDRLTRMDGGGGAFARQVPAASCRPSRGRATRC